MAPAWEALAKKYRDHKDIIIAELDATANELEAFVVHAFPTLKYFPAGPGRKVRQHPTFLGLRSESSDGNGAWPQRVWLQRAGPGMGCGLRVQGLV